MPARIAAFDGVRGTAVLLILALHSGYGPHFLGGGLGIEIFFVLSGYLISTLLIQERERWGSVSLSSFYLRRIARLAPALVLTLVAAGMAYRLLPDGTFAAYAGAVAAVVTYTANIAVSLRWSNLDGLGHTWSLAEEEQFYLLWPVILMFLLRLRRQRWAIALVVLGVAASWASLVLHHGPSIDGIPQAYFRPDSRAGSLLLGGLLALVVRDLRVRRVLAAHLTGVLSLVALVGVIIAAGRTRLDFLNECVPLAALASMLLIGHLSQRETSVPARLFSVAPLRWVGQISYGAYLYSGLFNAATDRWMADWSTPAIALIRTLAAVALAAVSYYLVEQPIRVRAGAVIAQRRERLHALSAA
ncbi:hypothetical protein Back2_13760 [Nocardioides baekrokdamisoli]|uniref:Acyltransferase 3 domain-containing protein n=1 Tax=Nocardioides baekrokdamisoli TaxID=1804624 RepID=A0A3G9J271_9ACTN|nr:acyltransferase [Nocardioides baekrokdamisoli]BBH17089.1 hypothetical protein Back2_13760 [Nocardioides baekrokdamisoli]